MDCSWKQLKPYYKKLLIMNYVSNLKNRHKLTSEETIDLFNVIQLGFSFKELTAEDVEYSDKEIKGIRGLKYNQISREWCTTNTPCKTYRSKKKPQTHKFTQAIHKFLQEYRLNHI